MTQTEFYAILREPIGAILAAHPGPEGPALALALLAAAVALVVGLGLTVPIALVAGGIDGIANLARWIVSPRAPVRAARPERPPATAPRRAEAVDPLAAPALPLTANADEAFASGEAARPLSAWTGGGLPLGAAATAFRAEPVATEAPPVVLRPAPALHLVAFNEPSTALPAPVGPAAPADVVAEPVTARIAAVVTAAGAVARDGGRVLGRAAAAAGRAGARAAVATRTGLGPVLARLGPTLGRGARTVWLPLRDLLPFGWHQGRFVRYRRDRTGRRYYYSRRRLDPQHRRSRAYTD